MRSVLLVLAIVVGCSTLSIAGENWKQISYQGRLTSSNGQPLPDSSYSVQFRFFEDSISGSSIWIESATVTTTDGFFNHYLGSNSNLPDNLASNYSSIFLEISLGLEKLLPRTRLLSSPHSLSSSGLSIRDSRDSLVIQTSADHRDLIIFNDSISDTSILLSGLLSGDSAVILPDSSISAIEILDEPGLNSSSNATIVNLTTNGMTDLISIDLLAPAEGYVVLHGKCFVVLSGTTGANTARIQIDLISGGVSQFPYYSQVGLSGYVNNGPNYFPVYVTKVYYVEAGEYSFIMEGMAINSTPAVAESWDHILTATYYPTSYYIPFKNGSAISIESTGSDSGDISIEQRKEIRNKASESATNNK